MVLSRLVMDPKDSNFNGQKVQFILLPQKCKIENAVSMRFLSPKKSSNFNFQFRIASGFIFYCGLWYFLRRHHQIYIPWIRGRRKIIAFPVWPTSTIKQTHTRWCFPSPNLSTNINNFLFKPTIMTAWRIQQRRFLDKQKAKQEVHFLESESDHFLTR